MSLEHESAHINPARERKVNPSVSIEIEKLKGIVFSHFLKSSYTNTQANMMTDVVMFGELSGRKSHGIGLLTRPDVVWKNKDEREDPRVTNISTISSSVEGKGNPGILVGPMAMIESIRLARENQIGITNTSESFSTIGALSYYAETIAKNGFLGIVMSTSRPVVAPFNSGEAIFGSNPIAISAPSKSDPLVLDLSTAAISFGSVMESMSRQQLLPTGTAIDNLGQDTVKPEEAVKGALLPFGSYKGAGLAMMIELIAGAWSGADAQGKEPEKGWGNLFITLSPGVFGLNRDYAQTTQTFINNLRNTHTRDGMPIRIPGEISLQTRNNNLRLGYVQVDPLVLSKLS